MGVAGVAGKTGQVARADVLKAGRRRFLACERIDLLAIATELGIARATVYRWFGGRNEFEGQVLWSLAADTLDRELQARPRSGPGALTDALIAMLSAISGHPSMRHYLDADPKRAMTVLTGRDSVVSGGLRRRVAEVVVERSPQSLTPDLSGDDLAYALVRLSEAFTYSDILAGRAVDLDRARPIFHRLLEAS